MQQVMGEQKVPKPEFLGNWVSLYVSSVCFDLLSTSLDKLLCVWVNFFVHFTFFPQFIIPTTQDLMRIAKQQEELVEWNVGRDEHSQLVWVFTKKSTQKFQKLLTFQCGEACIQRFCFIGNLIWVQRVIWMQIPATFKKGL